jgi:hypothetical protein
LNSICFQLLDGDEMPTIREVEDTATLGALHNPVRLKKARLRLTCPALHRM